MVFLIAFALFGLERASAQLAAPAAPMVPSPGPPASGSGANNTLTTKLVRIYNGAGYFDDALAEQLRPMLAKAFPFAVTEPSKAAPGATVAAPLKPETQKKVVEANR